MNQSFRRDNKRSQPIIATTLSVVLALLSGCTAQLAQQKIDTQVENAIALLRASEFGRLDLLERHSKCRWAPAAFAKLNTGTNGAERLDSQLRQVLEYTRHAYMLQRYMEEKNVTAEAALTAMGDLMLPPFLAPETDPFNGCVLFLNAPLDKPFTDQAVNSADQGGNFTDGFVFYWQSRDFGASTEAQLQICEKFLPHKKRTPFDLFLIDYSFTLSKTLTGRLERGEITLLQYLKAWGAGHAYLMEQGKQYMGQLKANLARAKAHDKKLLAGVATGLGVVATAALAVAVVDANYRIANAQRLQTLQAHAPIRCYYRLPDRYGSGSIICR